MPQQTFRSHDDKWLAPRANDLAPQTMKVLRRGGGINDLQVVLGGEVEETLEPRARVLGPLPFEAVRQEQDQPAEPLPLIFRAGDELVDDWLGGVPEIAELRFPHDQSVRIIETVTVFKTQHAHFRKRTVENLDWRLVRGEMLERCVQVTILDVVQHSMALAESATLGVLAA